MGEEAREGRPIPPPAPHFFFFFGNHFEERQIVLFEVELIIDNNAPLTYV